MKQAFYWCQKAAENGHIDAQYNLASLYLDGKGIEKDLKKSFIGLKKQQKVIMMLKHNIT